MKKVLFSSLDNTIVPIINENDVLSQEELDFSDNDELSALVAAMI
jgi:glutamate 5-kinase